MAEQRITTAEKKRRGGRKPTPIKFAITGEPRMSDVYRVQLMLLQWEHREIESAVARFKGKEAEYAEEARRELAKVHYRRRLPIHRVDIKTEAGVWRAVVEKYQPADRPLGYYHVRYGVMRLEPQFEGGRTRRIGLWVQRRHLTERGHVHEVAKALAAWLEDDDPEGEYLCDVNGLAEYTPVWPDLPDDLLGVAGARVRLRRDPELIEWAAEWLREREREAHPFTARMTDEQFEAHWRRVHHMRLDQHALEVVTHYAAATPD